MKRAMIIKISVAVTTMFTVLLASYGLVIGAYHFRNDSLDSLADTKSGISQQKISNNARHTDSSIKSTANSPKTTKSDTIQSGRSVNHATKSHSASDRIREPRLRGPRSKAGDNAKDGKENDDSPELASIQTLASAKKVKKNEARPDVSITISEDTPTPADDNKPSPMMKKLGSVISEFDGEFTVFTTSTADYALTFSDNGYTMISPDGAEYTFQPDDSGAALMTTGGTKCDFVAGNENLSLGKMTDEAFVLMTAGGHEHTLRLSLSVDSEGSLNDKPEEPTAAMQTLTSLQEKSPGEYQTFVSTDEQYAMRIDMSRNGNLLHTIVTDKGELREFEPCDKNYSLITSSGTECALAGSGDDLAVGCLTDDAYVLMASAEPAETGMEPTYKEYTLFSTGEDANYTVVDSDSMTDANNQANDQNSGQEETATDSATKEETVSIASTNPLHSADEDAKTESSGEQEQDQDLDTEEISDMPLWAMSIAERRVARRQRYSAVR